MTPDDSYRDNLSERIAALDASLGNVHETLKAEGVKRDKRIRTNRVASFLAGLIAVVGILVGLWGLHAIHDSNEERDAARVGSCLQYNKQGVVQTEAEIAQSHDFVAALTKGSVDPDIQEKADAYNREHDALIRKSHPERDCSPGGIEKYLKTK